MPTLLTVAIVIGVFALLWWGWRSRRDSQAAVLPRPARPAEGTTVIGDPIDGTYVVTTLSGQHLERVAAHGLGIRTSARLSFSDAGVILDRDGGDDLLIPVDAILDVSTTSGMIGKFVERDGIVVITWKLGDTPVDTGFRTRAAADRQPTIDHIRQLIGEAS
ncbi:transporter [Brevibacterium daeguense]|uniref:Transporter n=1 Tax=Brevibacterium daeguense TaxID=909936 RepID=A0ABP8ENC3_9MICO|nr:hypothetical protein [Brevibacterium daeguense]